MPFCMCSTIPALVFACSGAADVGEIADRSARQLEKRGTARMACLAGIGGQVAAVVSLAQAAGKLLVIDGCGHDCGRRCLENGGFSGFLHLRLNDLDLETGNSPPTEERVRAVTAAARRLLLEPATNS